MPLLFAFDHRHDEPIAALVRLLGRDGAERNTLAWVLGPVVPPGFTISTTAGRSYRAEGWTPVIEEEVARHVAALEVARGKHLGASDDPLLLRVHADGGPASVVGPADAGRTPADPRGPLRAVVEALLAGPPAGDGDPAPAVHVEVVVGGGDAVTDVVSTRDPATGERTGAWPELAEQSPAAHEQLLDAAARIEAHHRDLCELELTVEGDRLWVRGAGVGRRSGAAAVRLAVEMTEPQRSGAAQWRLSRQEALLRVTGADVQAILHPQFADADGGAAPDVLLTGIGASPGAGVGRAYFSADEAAGAADRGESVILVRDETSPEDVHGMIVADGIVTARGGLTSHAAVVARGWGKPAVVGAEAMVVGDRKFTVGDVTVHEGELLSIDGSTGIVVRGEVGRSAGERPPELETLLGWADEVRAGGRIGVRANADTAGDAATARDFGAEGIGLCRTEHMFLGEDRLPIVRRMILAATPDEERAALADLHRAQQADFLAILEAMDGLPVTVRLLDPPLHEFLPKVDELERRDATTGLDDEERSMLRAAREWHETNPMLGTRGVRLAVLKPGLYAMQVRALVEAATTWADRGGNPIVQVMIPLTVAGPELGLARRWVEEAAAAVAPRQAFEVSVGTMIETPRAALLAGELALYADFFSIGTNDLTQMTFGFSRDDVAARVIPAYLAQGLLDDDPFAHLDREGVGALIATAIEHGRRARPELEVGVCGEHGGDPASIDFLVHAGVDYVSCSPFRVPIARLAVAQAIIRAAGPSGA